MAKPTKFPSRLSHIQPGEPVSASVASRPDRALEGRTNYLKEIIDSIEAGRALVLRDQAVAANVLNGQPVYWDATEQQYTQGLAQITNDLTTGMLVPAASADVIGVAINKRAGNRADIVLWGVVQLSDLSNVIDGAVLPGRYYLSGVTPGKLVRQRPPVTVSICVVFGPLDACDQNTWVFVMPQMRDFLEDHIHYQFALVARPAGDHVPPLLGEPHVLSNADEQLPGWLPADHASFNGNAPPGAHWGYNLKAHAALEQLWPPIPAAAAVLEWLHPENTANTFNGLQRVPGSLVVIDHNGIWWLSNCYGEVPWPATLDTTLSSSSVSLASVSSLSSSSATCPTPTTMQLLLSFIKMTFATDKTVVTSLQPDSDQPLVYVNCNGEPANTGDLFTRLQLDLLINATEVYGGQALKSISNNRFDRGWLTEGLLAGSSVVQLSGSRTRLLDPTLPASNSNPTVHQGLVTVDVQLDPTERELLPQIVVLGDAVERLYKQIPYIGFPNGRDSGVRLKFVIPPEGLPSTPKLLIRIVLFGRTAGTLTDLHTTYYRLARPTIAVPTPVTEGDLNLPLNTAITVLADYAYEVESSQITIQAGDTLFVSLERLVSGTPTYDAEIGLLRASAILVSGV